MNKQILYTACITPFMQDSGTIDFISLEKLLRMQVTTGNGLVIFGSTGEGLSLSSKEKREMLEFICQLKLNTQLIIGVPSHNFAEALEWINFCNQMPIDGYLLTTPVYTKPGILGQTKWFEALLEASKYPTILYNIPSRAGVRLHTETVQNLAQHQLFSAIKDSGGTVESIVDYQIAAPNIAIYCGDDYLMPAMAAEGAVGLISVASNAWPKAVREYVKQSLSGGNNFSQDERRADDAILKDENSYNKIWWRACRALFAASNPIPIKALLKEIGFIESDIVRLPLSREDLSSIDELMTCHKLINLLEEKHHG